ncbi:MAG: aspartate/glutamate racemase family protein [Myxococcales bacterium]|nr:aspartate/glutamate racemase family protein [Myxococcales bacterium]
MKKIGMIGGLAWPSTIDYYRALCERTNQHHQAAGHPMPSPSPELVLESLDIAALRKLRGVVGDEASWSGYDKHLRAALMRLRTAGAEVGFIASNTPHLRLAAATADVPLKMISILDATAQAARSRGYRRALILGTPLTMQSGLYQDAMAAHGIGVCRLPSPAVVERLDHFIDVELCQDDVQGAADTMLTITRAAMAGLEQPEQVAVCLACTELPRAFPERLSDVSFRVDEVGFINTIAAHVEAIFGAAVAGLDGPFVQSKTSEAER